MKEFTREMLSEFNGKNGKSAYIGYKGIVYDVTGSFQWKEGIHWVIHEAGTDLTQAMSDAPHFDDLLTPLKIVGSLRS